MSAKEQEEQSKDLELTWDVRDTRHKAEHSFPTLMRRVYEHPYVQRMNLIKQLGLVFLAFPGATHTRLEHSIGVAINVDNWLNKITVIDVWKDGDKAVPKKPEISLRARSMICLAGLLHDIGHCWFSHLFDHEANKYLDAADVKANLHHHEPRSVLLTGLILREVGGFSEFEIECIQNMILGKNCFQGEAGMKAAAESGIPFWAYLLVASLIDADKLDYEGRDLDKSIGPGMCPLQVDRIMSHSSIFIEAPFKARMVFRSSTNVFGASEIEQVFTTRFHNYAIYRHHSILAAELDIIEMMPQVIKWIRTLHGTLSGKQGALWWLELTDAAFFAFAPIACPEQYKNWLGRKYSWRLEGAPRSFRVTNKPQEAKKTDDPEEEGKTTTPYETKTCKTVVTTRGFHSKGIDVTKELFFYHKDKPTVLKSLPELEGNSLLERVIFERVEYDFVKSA